MGLAAKYVSKMPDQAGFIAYTATENQMWQELMATQLDIVPGRACPEFEQGLRTLDFTTDRIPQCEEVSSVLRETS